MNAAAMDAHARRAAYAHKAAKAQEACSPVYALALMLYPTVLGFLLAGRIGVFSLLVPTPTISGAPPSSAGRLHGDSDLWDANDHGLTVRTVLAYVLITVVHLFTLFILVVHGVPGSWYVKQRLLPWVVPMVLWMVTSTFCFFYATLARYRANRPEWTSAMCVSVFLFVATASMLNWGCTLSEVLDQEEDPEVPAAAVAAVDNQQAG